MITIYTLPDCPNCESIKAKLEAAGYEYQETDMSTPENLTELRLNGCFAGEAPVLRVDNTFYEYCACKVDGFFAELFGVRPDQQEIPQYDGRMKMKFLEEYVR
jgi:glutaredoxin 3